MISPNHANASPPSLSAARGTWSACARHRGPGRDEPPTNPRAMTNQEPETMSDHPIELREAVARELWSRFAPTYSVDYAEDSNRAEYERAAGAILRLVSPSTGWREPVAWRVKDFADGWTLCHTEAQARREADSAGNLVEPLYALSASPLDGEKKGVHPEGLPQHLCAESGEAELPGWRPIETAPQAKEGERPIWILLAWTSNDGSRHVGEAYWHAGEGDWWWANTSPGDYYSDSVTNSITGRVIAWMPLPEPPTNTERGGAE